MDASRRTGWWVLGSLIVGLTVPLPAFAADSTPPSTPVVTDGGAYTTSLTELSVSWTSLDPESPSLFCSLDFRQGSVTGTIIANRTLSCGTFTSALFGGLPLQQGVTYYIGVKARNSDGLWSAAGFSNGIKVDATAPSAPGRPTEGSTSDLDYDNNGIYTVYWPAASDAQSGIAAYELQEQVGTAGTWTTLVTTASRNFAVSGRAHNTRYYYQVRAKNNAGAWGAWSSTSDGMLVDTSAPATVTVTDDGATTTSTTQLHATWTASSDPESGVSLYQYLIRQDSTSGTIIVNYTSVGLATQVTRTGLALAIGKTYFIGVRARNGAGTHSATRYSDGIQIQAAGDTQPPQVSAIGVTNITDTSALLNWTTNETASCLVRCGTSSPPPALCTITSGLSHATELSLLTPATTHYVSVTCTDTAGNESAASTTSFTTAAPTVPTQPSLITINGRQLLLQRRNPDGTLAPAAPYIIRGMTWSPASRTTNTTTTDPNNAAVRRPEFGVWYLTDIPLLKAMNVNTVRLYIDPGITGSEVSLGLRILDELYRNNIMVIMTVDNAVNDTGRISWVVSSYQNHPAILMWSLGNEWNINRYYGVASSVLDAAQRTQNAAALIKSLDTVHPVVSSYGEINFGGPETQLAATQNYVNNVCPSVDVWGLNLYRGQTFTTLWSQWASIATKPMFIGEFGVDAYETTSGTVNEAAQAQWDVSLWDDIARNLSANDPAKVGLGGTIFEWNDEWWKVFPPGSQETGGWASGAFPDGVGNEEYFGVVTIDRVLRQAYGALTAVLHPSYVPPARAVTFQAISRGASAAEWNGQYGFAKFLQDGTVYYTKNGGGGGGRGFNVAAVNAATGAVLNSGQNFDTWITRTTGTAMNAMVDYLESLPNNTLVLVAVADDAGLNLDNSCTKFSYPWVGRGLTALQTLLGSTQIQNYCFRNSFALAGVKGEASARAEQQGSGIEATAQAVLTVP